MSAELYFVLLSMTLALSAVLERCWFKFSRRRLSNFYYEDHPIPLTGWLGGWLFFASIWSAYRIILWVGKVP